MTTDKGPGELRRALARHRRSLIAVCVFSLAVNALMLTGPVFMLQVYDRVLASRSEATLVALLVIVAFLFAMMGLLDYARGRVMARIGADIQDTLDARVFSAVLERAARGAGPGAALSGLRDLEAVQRVFTAPVFFAVFDMPWTPVFLMAIFAFHAWLGVLALLGGGILVVVTALNQMTTSAPAMRSAGATSRSVAVADNVCAETETVKSLGMREALFRRWKDARDRALAETVVSSDRTGVWSTASRTFRLFLQSAMLALGAYLVLRHELTAGAMVAASILLGRALAPVEQAIGNWALVQRARRGWASLGALLEEIPREPPRTALPRPKGRLEVRQLTVMPPGGTQATLRMVSFGVGPGEALGVIGQSGAGKSTLARAITGVWPPAAGTVRLDGAALDRYDPDELGRHIGYLPQKAALFAGTVAENIARMAGEPDAGGVVEAARKAGAHDMILGLANGYDTVLSTAGSGLSGGQIQRIGLARALYGDPVLLVLDEPNASLDADGIAALNLAIREMKDAGGAVVIMTHRPAGIAECDLLLVMEAGMRRAFGPRDEVLRREVENHARIAQPAVREAGP